MHLPQFKLLFDIGRGSSRLVEVPRLLLTHGHLDHSAGLPYYIAQRCLRRLPAADVYCPPSIAEPLDQILKIWSLIEGYNSIYNLIPLDYSKAYALQGNFYFRAIPSIHRVQSNGYSIIEKVRKLKAEYHSLPGPQIARLKESKPEIFFDQENVLITFSGDTQIEFLLENDSVQKSRILFLECTYISEDRPVKRARKWGHIHLFEIAAHAEAFRNIEKLYLIHFSPRYSHKEIKEKLKQHLPDWLYQRTTPFLSLPTNRR